MEEGGRKQIASHAKWEGFGACFAQTKTTDQSHEMYEQYAAAPTTTCFCS